jgi:hypothetical protein
MRKIYIDESGDLGTGGRYFVIGALCTEDGKRIRNIIKKHCAKNGIDELKNFGIRIKAYTEWGFAHNIHTEYLDSKADRLIQAADFIAGNCYQRYHHNKSHIYNILKPDISIKFPNTQFGR